MKCDSKTHISLCYASLPGGIGFLRDYRRLNVALTRAKRMLVLFGHADTLGKKKKNGTVQGGDADAHDVEEREHEGDVQKMVHDARTRGVLISEESIRSAWGLNWPI